MIIDDSGKVGIGTSSPSQNLHIVCDSGDEGILLKGTGNTSHALTMDANRSSAGGALGEIRGLWNGTEVARMVFRGGDDTTNKDDGFITFATSSADNISERMRIDTAGNIGIGTTSPDRLLDVSGTGNVYGKFQSTNATGAGIEVKDTSEDWIIQADGGTVDGLAFYDLGRSAYRMIIDDGGKVGIGTTSPQSIVHIDGANDNTYGQLRVSSPSNGDAQITFGTTQNGRGMYVDDSDTNKFKIYTGGGKGSNEFVIDNSGNVTVAGSLSKGSGSFQIDHPLDSKKDTHYLVHSFIEGPQADNIYRGTVTLSSGTATVDLDSVSSMTSGTFVELNREVQCFTTNETGWTAVKGSVSGNVLTITAQDNNCTDTISWMVVGERQDQHMIETGWTDENGKVILEPEREPEGTVLTTAGLGD